MKNNKRQQQLVTFKFLIFFRQIDDLYYGLDFDTYYNLLSKHLGILKKSMPKYKKAHQIIPYLLHQQKLQYKKLRKEEASNFGKRKRKQEKNEKQQKSRKQCNFKYEAKEEIYKKILYNYTLHYLPKSILPVQIHQIVFPRKTKLKKNFKEFKILELFQKAVRNGKFDLFSENYETVKYVLQFQYQKISNMIKKHKIKQEFCESVLTKRRKHTQNLEINSLLLHLKNKRKLLKNLKSEAITQQNIIEGSIENSKIFDFIKSNQLNVNFLQQLEKCIKMKAQQQKPVIKKSEIVKKINFDLCQDSNKKNKAPPQKQEVEIPKIKPLPLKLPILKSKKVRQIFLIHRNVRQKSKKRIKLSKRSINKKKINKIQKKTIILSRPSFQLVENVNKIDMPKLPSLERSQSIFQFKTKGQEGFSKFKRRNSVHLKRKEKSYKKPPHLQKILESILSDPKNFQSAVNVYMNQTNNIFVTNNFNFNFPSGKQSQFGSSKAEDNQIEKKKSEITQKILGMFTQDMLNEADQVKNMIIDQLTKNASFKTNFSYLANKQQK